MAESPVHSALGDDEAEADAQAEADAAESPVLIAMSGPMSPEPPETPHSPDSQLLKQTADAQAVRCKCHRHAVSLLVAYLVSCYDPPYSLVAHSPV